MSERRENPRAGRRSSSRFSWEARPGAEAPGKAPAPLARCQLPSPPARFSAAVLYLDLERFRVPPCVLLFCSRGHFSSVEATHTHLRLAQGQSERPTEYSSSAI